MTHPMRGRLSATMQAAIEREWGAMLCGQEQWDRLIIAVLRTLREPDEGMVEMGVAYFPVADTPYRPDEYDPAVRQVFTAMISSILPEEKP